MFIEVLSIISLLLGVRLVNMGISRFREKNRVRELKIFFIKN